MAIIRARKQTCWPIKTNTVKLFNENEDLKRLRMFVRGDTLKHTRVTTEPGRCGFSSAFVGFLTVSYWY